jgi:isopenicillin N synthase-like dioxygenase
LIDLSKYRHANTLSGKRKTADEIVDGFKEVGFIYLQGHGIPSSTVDNVFRKVCPFKLVTRQPLVKK